MTDDIANDLRAEIAKILKRFDGCDIGAIRMTTVKKIDRLLNPEPETFDLEAWLFAPSRDKPLASAFAVNASRGVL